MSNDTKWSKGEWLLDGNTVYALNDEKDPVNRFSATVCAGADGKGYRVSDEEAHANAQLMRSAKELYEALEEITTCYVNAHSKYSQVAKNAREALAEARGETS